VGPTSLHYIDLCWVYCHEVSVIHQLLATLLARLAGKAVNLQHQLFLFCESIFSPNSYHYLLRSLIKPLSSSSSSSSIRSIGHRGKAPVKREATQTAVAELTIAESPSPALVTPEGHITSSNSVILCSTSEDDAVGNEQKAPPSDALVTKYREAMSGSSSNDTATRDAAFSGWIWKKGDWRNPYFQRRWGVLQEGKLAYYKSEEDAREKKKARGEIAVAGMRIQRDTGSDLSPAGDPLALFSITPTNTAENRGHVRTIVLGAESQELRARWVDALADADAAMGKGLLKGSRSSFSLKEQPEWVHTFIVRPVEHGVNSGRPVILRAADLNDMHDWLDQVAIRTHARSRPQHPTHPPPPPPHTRARTSNPRIYKHRAMLSSTESTRSRTRCAPPTLTSPPLEP